jgi:fibronectin type 3 domain-containing protein
MFGRVVYQDKDVNRLMVKFDVDVQKGLYILEVRSGDEWNKFPITRE